MKITAKEVILSFILVFLSERVDTLFHLLYYAFIPHTVFKNLLIKYITNIRKEMLVLVSTGLDLPFI